MNYEVGDTVMCPLPPRVGKNELNKYVAVVVEVKDNSLVVTNGFNETKEVSATNVNLVAKYTATIEALTRKGVELCKRVT